MVAFDQKIVMWVIVTVAAYLLYRLIFSSKDQSLTNYEREIEEILTSEKHKVKGRFEE